MRVERGGNVMRGMRESVIEILNSVLNESVRNLKTIQFGISEGELFVRQRMRGKMGVVKRGYNREGVRKR